MREIKFRLWDKSENKMRYEIDSIRFDIDDRLPFSVAAIPGYGKSRLVGKTWIDDDGNRILHGNEEGYLMQYTGLKDKNGKEIYEGDIVLFKNEMADWKGSVVFDEGAFKLSVNHSWGNSIHHFTKTDVFEDMGARTTLNNTYEIIGNIYENPELLGGASE